MSYSYMSTPQDSYSYNSPYGEELVKPLVTEIQQTPAAAPKILDEEGVRIPESLT